MVKALNLGTVVVLMAVGVVAVQRWWPTQASPETLSPALGIDVAQGPTLVIVVQASCAYCTEAMPFYRTLVQQTRRAQIVVAAPDDITAYLAEHDLTPDAVIQVRDRLDVPIQRTPAILAVDRTGTITAIWQGALSPDHEADVLAYALSNPRSNWKG